ncbi:glycosyltransferase family 4 protein, partial [Bacteroides ovatus]
MNLIFLQNCISPHQMPYIKELPVYESVDRVVVVAPRIDYDDRKQMGWKTPELLKVEGIEFLITPTIEVVQKLYEECKGIETFCFFSGINAFPEIVPWMKLSFNYPFKRGVITEPPLLYNHPLWQHKLRFALKDWRYIKYFDYLLVMGDEFVP